MSEYIEPILDAEKISTLNNNPRTFFHESYLNENNDNFEKMNYVLVQIFYLIKQNIY